jgi:3-hydroxybutyryl-CoA dehydrogenase
MAIKKVGVLGCGLMGSGIAQVSAMAGYNVVVLETEQKAIDKGFAGIEKSLGKLTEKPVEKGGITAEQKSAAQGRMKGTLNRQDLADCDLIVEAIIENVEIKKKMYADLDAIVKKDCIFATNTASISVTDLMAATKRPERFIGLHFFNPVWAMSLVEVVTGAATAPTTIAQALTVCRQLGKETIVVENSPGFASSRLGICLGLEAMRMVEEGIASPADIDRAMELGYKHPMGPLRLTDLVGLDVRLDIAHTLEAALGPRFAPPQILVDRVAAGELGKKTGRGFYDWSSGNAQPRGAQP